MHILSFYNCIIAENELIFLEKRMWFQIQFSITHHFSEDDINHLRISKVIRN